MGSATRGCCEKQMSTEDRTARTKEELSIAVALSGGGVRASAFHFGVLQRLACERLLEQVTFISTVSGGSLGTGLVYSLGGNRWPTSEQYLTTVLPRARQYLTHTDIERDILWRTLTRPWLLWQGRAKYLAETLRRRFGVTALLGDIPTEPRWVINATTYETGKNWRFMPQRMGDYVLNYVMQPSIPLAEAMAASAAYPGLIGPIALDTARYRWHRYLRGEGKSTEPTAPPQVRRVHLWDGGVYDNLGVEALFKAQDVQYREEYNFLVVSDASKPLGVEDASWLYNRAVRLVSIAMDQVRSLRARELVRHFGEHPGSGVYLKMGRDARYLLSQGGQGEETIAAVAERCLSDEEVGSARDYPTTLRRLSEVDFDRLCRHGFEVASCVLLAYCPTLFPVEHTIDALCLPS